MTKITEAPKFEQRHFDALECVSTDVLVMDDENDIRSAIAEIPAILRELVAENERLTKLERDYSASCQSLEKVRRQMREALQSAEHILRRYPEAWAEYRTGPGQPNYFDFHNGYAHADPRIEEHPTWGESAAPPQASAAPDAECIQRIIMQHCASTMSMDRCRDLGNDIYDCIVAHHLALVPQPAAVPDRPKTQTGIYVGKYSCQKCGHNVVLLDGNGNETYQSIVGGTVPDGWLTSRVADLLHLLQFAEITTPSAADSEQAKKAMADIQKMLTPKGAES